MTRKDHAYSATNLPLFREKVTAARREAGRLQKELADAVGIDAQVLSRKLHGAKQSFPTHTEVKQIIKTLADWDAITTRVEASELLALMGLRAESFSAYDWQSAPLNRLEATPQSIPSPPSPAPVLHISSPLPIPPTLLIGREYHVQMLLDRIRQAPVRLLTLLGTGGVGKTRLALEVAHAARHDFADGVFFVSLAAIRDLALVPATLVQALHITEAMAAGGGGRQRVLSHKDVLTGFLRHKKLLLIVDNVEQIPEITAFIADLLKDSTTLKVIATSRAVLNLQREYEFNVPPLALCSPDHVSSLDYVAQFAAIRLFVERAQAVNHAFQITQHNAATIAHICACLDGLPLAIELAAVRARVLSLPTILQRLTSGTSLTFLRATAHNAFHYHQTLYATLAWSYELLDPMYQTLFRRLCVFLGSWTVEAVCAFVEDQTVDDVRERIEFLINQSLVKQTLQEETLTQEQQEPRFHLLETIREYGLGQLEAAGEREDIQRRHATYYLTLAERIEADLSGVEQSAAIIRLSQEQDNLHAALVWANEHDEAEIALRISSVLGRFWEARTHFHEAHRWIDAVFKMKAETPLAAHAKLLMGASRLARWEIGCERSRELAQEALTLYEAADDPAGRAWANFQISDTWHMQGDYAQASKYMEESLRLLHEQADLRGYAFTLSRLGALATLRGNIQQARLWLDEAVTLLREYQEPGMLTVTLVYLGILSIVQGTPAQSITYLREGLLLTQQTGNRYMSATALLALGCVLGITREPAYTARLCSAAEVIYASLNTPVPAAYRPLYDTYRNRIKAQVDVLTWETWWAEGKALSLAELYALAQ